MLSGKRLQVRIEITMGSPWDVHNEFNVKM